MQPCIGSSRHSLCGLLSNLSPRLTVIMSNIAGLIFLIPTLSPDVCLSRSMSSFSQKEQRGPLASSDCEA